MFHLKLKSVCLIYLILRSFSLEENFRLSYCPSLKCAVDTRIQMCYHLTSLWFRVQREGTEKRPALSTANIKNDQKMKGLHSIGPFSGNLRHSNSSSDGIEQFRESMSNIGHNDPVFSNLGCAEQQPVCSATGRSTGATDTTA